MENRLFGIEENRTKLALASIACGLAYEVLFLFCGLGLNMLIYTGLITIVTFWALSFSEGFIRENYIFYSSVEVLLSASFVFSTNPFFLTINFFLIPVLHVISVITSFNSEKVGVAAFFSQIFVSFAHAGRIFPALFSKKTAADENKDRRRKIILGIVLGIFALILIVPIMISADAAFSELLSNLIRPVSFSRTLTRAVSAALVSMYAYGFIYHSFHSPRGKQMTTATFRAVTERDIKAANDYAVTAYIFLVMVLAAYMIFTAVNCFYLYLKVDAGLGRGFDYASYARSGVFYLWALTAIDLFITLFLSKRTSLADSADQKKFRKIYLLFTVANLILTFSAFYKMRLYTSFYGLTRYRLLVLIYLCVQFCLLIVLIYKIYIPSFEYVKKAFVTVLVLYTLLNFANVDGIVAKQLIGQYEATGKIDRYYINYGLSYDSLPIVWEYFSAHPEDTLSKELTEHINSIRHTHTDDPWQEFNLVIKKIDSL